MNNFASLAASAPEVAQVLVADDHVLVAETVAATLGADNGFAVQTAIDVDDTLEKIRAHGRFDVVLLDYDLPGMNALEGMRRIIEANQGGVALFSGVVSWTIVESAIDQGASGFIPKTLPLKTLGHAVRFIAEGEVYLPVEYVRHMNRAEDRGFGLKPRETKVLSFLCEGLQNKEIGRELGLDDVIVKMDVKSICRKLGARNRTQAVILARKHGLF